MHSNTANNISVISHISYHDSSLFWWWCFSIEKITIISSWWIIGVVIITVTSIITITTIIITILLLLCYCYYHLLCCWLVDLLLWSSEDIDCWSIKGEGRRGGAWGVAKEEVLLSELGKYPPLDMPVTVDKRTILEWY